VKANSNSSNKARSKAAGDPNQMDLFNMTPPAPEPSKPEGSSDDAELSSSPLESGASGVPPADPSPEREEGPAADFDEFDESQEAPGADVESQIPPEDPNEPPAIRLDFHPQVTDAPDPVFDETLELPAEDSDVAEPRPSVSPEPPIPPRADIPSLHPTPSATAEERLLDAIRGPEAPPSGGDPAAVRRLEERLGQLRAELEELREAGRVILADRDDAVAARQKAEADAERLQSRCRELEVELGGAQDALAAEKRARTEEAARTADAERVWKHRLAESGRLTEDLREERDALARRKFTPVSLAAALALAVAAAGVTVLVGQRGPADEGKAMAPSALPVGRAPASVLQAPRLPDTPMAASSATGGSAPAPASVVPWPAIKISGIKTVARGNPELALVFTYGVFARKTELTPQATDDLRQLAKVLKPYGGRLRLTVEGHTDAAPVTSGGPYSSNDELALARARVVRDFLCKEAGWPAGSAAVAAGKTAAAPYPGDTPELQRKNRTVVILLRR